MSFGLSRGKTLDPSGAGIEWDAVPTFDEQQWIDPRAWFLPTESSSDDDEPWGAPARTDDDADESDDTGDRDAAVDGDRAFTGHGRDPATVAALHDRLVAIASTPREVIDAKVPAERFEIEIGSGKGTFLVQQAALQQDTWFLGIEYAGEFWRYAADRIRRRGLRNVRLLYGDASEFLRFRVVDGVCRVIHLYFPDPWPKKRHHKRRMVQDASLQAFHRLLIPDGEVRIVTDHPDYWAWIEDHAARAVDAGLFARESFDRPASAGSHEVVGTNFERKYRREGRPFNAMVLRRQEA